ILVEKTKRESSLNVQSPRLSVIISSHFFTTGPAQELEAFLRSRTGELVSIFHPFYHSKSRCSIATQYARGQIEREFRIPTFSRFGAPSYLRDFLVTLFIALRLRKRYDLYIGSNPLNALAGLVLQKIRLVRETVFYKIDYVPI